MSDPRPPFELRLFGAPSLRDAENREVDSVLGQRKRFALLAYLAVETDRGSVRRDTVLGLLWPESSQRRARRALNQSLHYLRRELGSATIASVGDDGLSIEPSRLACDVVAFRTALEEGRLVDAVERYPGNLLEGLHVDDAPELERWIAASRDRLERSCADALERLAEEATASGRPRDAVRWWQRRTELDPYDAHATAALMEALESAGQRAAALARASEHAELMRREFDAEPDPDVAALAERLREAPAGSRVARAPLARATPREPEAAPSIDVADDPAPDEDAVASRPRWSRLSHIVAACLIVLVVYAVVATMPETEAGAEISGRRVVAIPFENRSDDPALDPVGRFASDWITQELARTGIVDVVPSVLTLRSARILEDGSDEAFPLALASQTGAGLLVTGSYAREGDTVAFQAQIVDAGSGDLVHAIDAVKGPRDRPLATIEELRRRIMGALATSLDPRLERWSAHASSPPSYEAYVSYARGLDLFFEKRYARAAEALRQAAEADPTFVAPLVWAGFAHGNAGEFDEAREVTREMTERRRWMSSWDRALYEMSLAGERGDRTGVLIAARRVASLAPGTEWSYVWSHQALKANRPGEALRALEPLDPASGWIREWRAYWGVLGDAYHALGRHEEELDAARRAREQHGARAYPDAEIVALGALGRVEEALDRVDALARWEGVDRPWLLETLAAELRFHHPERAEAVEAAWLDAIHTTPAEERRGWRHARAHLRAGQPDSTRAILRDLLEANPDDPWTRIGVPAEIAAIEARYGDRDAARKTLEWLEGLEPGIYRDTGPDSGLDLVMAARIAAALGERAHAVRLLHRAFREGWIGLHRIAHDPAFAALRDYPPFVRLTRPAG